MVVDFLVYEDHGLGIVKVYLWRRGLLRSRLYFHRLSKREIFTQHSLTVVTLYTHLKYISGGGEEEFKCDRKRMSILGRERERKRERGGEGDMLYTCLLYTSRCV